MTRARFDVAPLIDALRYRTAADGEPIGTRHKPLAVYLGIQPKTLYRWKETGVPEHHVERACITAGLVPYEVWPEILENAIAELDVVPCAREGCTETFIRSVHNRRYCCRDCKERAWRASPEGKAAVADIQRRQRAVPEVAERNRVKRRAYYAENRDYELARQRRYHAARRAAQQGAA